MIQGQRCRHLLMKTVSMSKRDQLMSNSSYQKGRISSKTQWLSTIRSLGTKRVPSHLRETLQTLKSCTKRSGSVHQLISQEVLVKVTPVVVLSCRAHPRICK